MIDRLNVSKIVAILRVQHCHAIFFDNIDWMTKRFSPVFENRLKNVALAGKKQPHRRKKNQLQLKNIQMLS